MKKMLLTSLAVAAGLALGPSIASGANFSVNSTVDARDFDTGDGFCDSDSSGDNNGPCTLRAAIQQANSLGGTNVVTLPAGTYTISLNPCDISDNSAGDFDINTPMTINGAGAGATIVDANTLDRAFEIQSNEGPVDVVINGITVRNGLPSLNGCGSTTLQDGGGILVQAGTSLTLNDSVVESSAGAEGGGIYNNGDLTVARTTINNNGAVFEGGGVGNTNVCLPSSVVITDSTISNNQAGNTGEISTEGDGGGISTGNGPVTVINSTISGNRAIGADVAGHGGGIYVNSQSCLTTVALRNVTVTNNTADFGGNFSGDGGGIAVDGGFVPEIPTLTVGTDELFLRNTIIAGNHDDTVDGTVNPDCTSLNGATIVSEGFNLIGDETGCDGFFNATGDQVGTSSSPIDARLNPLGNNGGATQTHALQSNSPAIDLANPTGCFTNDANNGSSLTADQRGEVRPTDGNGDGTSRCDIGAFEIPGVPACGNGVKETGEGCDDGNTVDTDACRNDCTSATCGDGIVQSEVEDCDDDNAVDTDACRNNCAAAVCGDGVVETGVEACDDGNAIDTDACRNNCSVAICGDGVVEAGVEECDDGNAANDDGCSSTCKTESPGGINFLLGSGGCSLIR